MFFIHNVLSLTALPADLGEFYEHTPFCQWLFPNYLHQHSFSASAVKFAIENLFPGAEIQFAAGYCHNDFPAHDLPFEVGIGIILAGSIMIVLRRRIVRGQFIEPDLVIMQKALLGIVDKNGGRDMHRVDQTDSFPDAAFSNQVLYGPGDIDKASAPRDFEPKLFSKTFHAQQDDDARFRVKPRRTIADGGFDDRD